MSLLQFDVVRAQKIIDVNLKGAINVLGCVLPILQKQQHGLIALTASVAGYRGLPNSLAYGASKAGLINLTESIQAELIDMLIDVRVINPGFVKTPLTDKNKFAMPCLITPEQAAQAIVKGLATNAFEIHFPKQFSFLMKAISSLPDKLYFHLVKRFK
jgi:short-subunit dehydrogenase